MKKIAGYLILALIASPIYFVIASKTGWLAAVGVVALGAAFAVVVQKLMEIAIELIES